MISHTRIRSARYAALTAAVLACLPWAAALAANNGDAALKTRIVSFLRSENASRPGRVQVTVHMPSVRMNPCHSPQPFLPAQGSRTAGRLTVGVRCPGDRPSTRYIQADVAIDAPYYIAAHNIDPGAIISAGDIRQVEGDITQLSDSVVTNPRDVVNRVAVRRIGAAMPMRTNMVAAPKLIKRGDSVQVVDQGQGFSITTRGKALDSAPRGGQVRVHTDSGTIVTGTPRDAHTVVITP